MKKVDYEFIRSVRKAAGELYHDTQAPDEQWRMETLLLNAEKMADKIRNHLFSETK